MAQHRSHGARGQGDPSLRPVTVGQFQQAVDSIVQLIQQIGNRQQVSEAALSGVLDDVEYLDGAVEGLLLRQGGNEGALDPALADDTEARYNAVGDPALDDDEDAGGFQVPENDDEDGDAAWAANEAERLRQLAERANEA